MITYDAGKEVKLEFRTARVQYRYCMIPIIQLLSDIESIPHGGLLSYGPALDIPPDLILPDLELIGRKLR